MVLAPSLLGPLALVKVPGCPLRGVVVDVVAQIVVVGGVGAVPVYHRNLVKISHGEKQAKIFSGSEKYYLAHDVPAVARAQLSVYLR